MLTGIVDDENLSVDKAADILGTTNTHILLLLRNGLLHGTLVDGSFLVSSKSILEFDKDGEERISLSCKCGSSCGKESCSITA